MQITLEQDAIPNKQDTTKRRKTKIQHRKQVLKEVTLLEQHLGTHRPRLVQMLTSADKLNNKCISVNDMLSIFSKMKIPVSQATIELMLDVLVIDDHGLLNYNQLLNGEVLRKVEEHFQQYDFKLTEDETVNPVIKESFSGDISTLLELDKHEAPSTMGGRNGALADEWKQEELKQFTLLIDYCKENGIILDWKLAEKGI